MSRLYHILYFCVAIVSISLASARADSTENLRLRDETRIINSTNQPCRWVSGWVKCPDSYGEHDGRSVVVRFVDIIRGKMDEGYTSKSGYFSLFGCSQDMFLLANPEVHVMHTCKSNKEHVIKIRLPNSVHGYYNFANTIDLNSFYSSETEYDGNIPFPCDPF